MEIPDLVRDRLGGEDITAGVNLGDEDALCLTPSKTIVYKGEGLLSDESVSVYPHDVERLTVSEGRRKAKFQFSYVDGTRSFSVPVNRSEPVLKLVLGAMLREDGVADPDETVEGVYRFSELTLIITEKRLVKHIGTAAWDEDYEEFPFADVTGLTFEQGSVATQIVLAVDGRPNRIKAPNDQAPMVRQTLEEALYEFHDVESLEELNSLLGSADEEPDATDPGAGFGLEEDIDPLVGGDEEEETVEASGEIGTMETVEEGEGLRPSSMDVDPTTDAEGGADDETRTTGDEPDAPDRAATESTSASDAETEAASRDATIDSAADGATDGTSGDDEPTGSGASGAEAAEAPGEGWDTTPGETSGRGKTSGSDAEAANESSAEADGAADAQFGAEEIEALETELAELRGAVESQNEELHEAIEAQNRELREAIEAQNEVLKKQHSAIKRLISELRSD